MDGIRGLGLPSTVPDGAAAPAPAGESGGFGRALSAALGEVEALQQAADAEAGKAALGAGNLHETALALEKADVSMRVAMKVRNKVVDAYQEIMRMSV